MYVCHWVVGWGWGRERVRNGCAVGMRSLASQALRLERDCLRHRGRLLRGDVTAAQAQALSRSAETRGAAAHGSARRSIHRSSRPHLLHSLLRLGRQLRLGLWLRLHPGLRLLRIAGATCGRVGAASAGAPLAGAVSSRRRRRSPGGRRGEWGVERRMGMGRGLRGRERGRAARVEGENGKRERKRWQREN